MFQNSFYGRLDKKAQYIIGVSFFMFFVNGLYGMLFGSLLPILSDKYQLDDTVSGLLVSGQQIGNLVAGFLSGIVPLYLGLKKSVVVLGSFVIIGFIILISGVGHAFFLFLAFFFVGISRGSVSNFTNKTVNDVSNSSPQALNLMHAIFAIGALISPFLLTLTMANVGGEGWKLILIMIIVFIILSQIFFSKADIDVQVLPKEKRKISFEFLKDSLFWVIIAILFFYMCSEAAITGWLVKFFVDTNVLVLEKAQLLSSFLWLGILIGRVYCSIVSGKMSRKRLLIGISLGMFVSFVALIYSQTTLTVILSSLALGATMGGIYPTAVTLAGVSIKQYPMAMGWILVTGGIGATVAPTFVGVLSDHFDLFFGMQSIIIMIGLMIVSIATYIVIERKRVISEVKI
ncbi:MFS transporter [Jeotgalibaca sp. MA1X17-3]|uniref:MFS transporter n=1 Tax=Jeotgalibaca sp. MA1X17-3 TaxID=2908211 RepID=UPI001F2CCFA9|nr:MFS transporter [Jeotgalibaca sp. MA1X17-3]UJF15708.1 MFS transporter [Jeotgalibaca sp. MA1X17-3]